MGESRSGGESGGAGGEPVPIAYARDRVEAGMLQGLLEDRGIPSGLQAVGVPGPEFGIGALGLSAQRILVRADQAEEARAVLADALVEDEDAAWPETANARHLENARGRKPRNYGWLGAYARIYLWSFVAMAVAFGIYLLIHAA